ncbi:MAG: hypothetical protein AAGG02_21770 [Cyanobacteria bacterium P01_H01_bin.15]
MNKDYGLAHSWRKTNRFGDGQSLIGDSSFTSQSAGRSPTMKRLFPAFFFSLSVLGLSAIAQEFNELKTLQYGPGDTETSGELNEGPLRVTVAHKEGTSENGSFTTYTAELGISVDDKPVFQLVGDEQLMLSTFVQIAEMDPSNPYPEVLYSTFTGGAHCCNDAKVLTSNPDGTEWTLVEIGFFDGVPHSVVDIDQDQVYEFVTSDNRFLYKYSSYVGSYPPTQILSLKGDRIEDLSKDPRFQALHREQAKGMWNVIQELEPRQAEINGILAGYAGTKALLGEFESGMEIVKTRYDRDSDWGLTNCVGGYDDQGECKGETITYESFPKALKAFLEETGYLSAPN